MGIPDSRNSCVIVTCVLEDDILTGTIPCIGSWNRMYAGWINRGWDTILLCIIQPPSCNWSANVYCMVPRMSHHMLTSEMVYFWINHGDDVISYPELRIRTWLDIFYLWFHQLTHWGCTVDFGLSNETLCGQMCWKQPMAICCLKNITVAWRCQCMYVLMCTRKGKLLIMLAH